MDLSRQRDFVLDNAIKKKILVIGVGAVGRNIAFMLTKMGCNDITIMDPDHVDESNVCSQGYSTDSIGKSKVQACLDEFNSGLKTMHKVWHPHEGYEYIFLAADCMKVRRAAFEYYSSRKPRCVIIDTRMRGEDLRVLVAMNKATDKHYTDTLFENEEALDGDCTSRTTIYCAMNAASLAVQRFAAHSRKADVAHDQLVGLSNHITITETLV